MQQAVMAAPKDIAEIIIGKRLAQVYTDIFKQIHEEVLDLLPNPASLGLIIVDILCKACKIFLCCQPLAPLVKLCGLVDSRLDLAVHIIIYVIEEVVEVLTEHLTESEVCNAFMHQLTDQLTV